MGNDIRLEIVNGPSHEEIRDSLGVRCRPRLKVTFTIADITPIRSYLSVGNQPRTTTRIQFETIIDGMEWDDGSGDKYVLKVLVDSFSDGVNRIGLNQVFTAHYNTKTRTGYKVPVHK